MTASNLRRSALALIVDVLKMLRIAGYDTHELTELMRICITKSSEVANGKMD